MKKSKKVLGTIFVIVILMLMAMSVTMIASLSFPRGQKEYNDGLHFMKMQIGWFFAGSIIFWLVSKIDYKKYRNNGISKLLYLTGFILLILVLFIGRNVNGAKRWLGIGSLGIQPSEFAKIIIILVLAGLIDKLKKASRKRKVGNKYSKRILDMKILQKVIICTVPYLALIFFEKSYSSMLQIGILGLSLLFVSGFSFWIFLGIIGAMGLMGYELAFGAGYRAKRIYDYIDSITGKSEPIYQTKQSLIAIARGNIMGQTYGNGTQKYYFLPEIHTDYIFSGYAEEMGLIGVLLLMALYISLIVVMVIVLIKVKNHYAKYLLVGIVTMFSVQIIGNIAVVTGLLPSTGIPLPLMSYGGSTTLVTMISLGIVFNIIKSIYEQEEETIEEFEYEM